MRKKRVLLILVFFYNIDSKLRNESIIYFWGNPCRNIDEVLRLYKKDMFQFDT